MALGPVPEKWEAIPQGVSTIFSPRSGTKVLDMYAAMLDGAESVACVTLAFGVSKIFKDHLVDNTGNSHVTFLLLEKRDKSNPRAKDPFISLTAKQNVYQAWGSYLHDPLYQWTRETSARILGLNQHVSYVHSKFMLKDPLGPDPIVITGSANFSEASTNANDENMVLIRGNERAGDIYFTEFNRLFYHYYFRSVQEATLHHKPADPNATTDIQSSLFLDPKDSWLSKYKPGSLRRKRVEIFTRMANAKTI
jgi:phosphatidylserine/phosphatidylglycerophosphate/cardiolipin synthase-like enzyme